MISNQVNKDDYEDYRYWRTWCIEALKVPTIKPVMAPA
jgi:hypothetical protein